MKHPFLPDLGAPLVLASGSPRRRDILLAHGLEFVVEPAHIEELQKPGEAPAAMVQRLSNDKGVEVARRHPAAVVLASDTIVVLDGAVLGKPTDSAEAESMLARLSGRSHDVLTGVALVAAGGDDVRVSYESTQVRFRHLTDGEIRSYVGTGEPMDKAGSYGIQGQGALLVESIQGCYFNVMGLPLQRLRDLWLDYAQANSRSAQGGSL